jgi:thioredoxin 1
MTPASSTPLELTKENVTQVLTSGRLVVIDMWASWCGPCKMFLPIFTAVAGQFEGEPDVVFAKCNIDEQPWISGQLQIKAVPTLIIARGERILHRESKVIRGAELVALVNSKLQG